MPLKLPHELFSDAQYTIEIDFIDSASCKVALFDNATVINHATLHEVDVKVLFSTVLWESEW